MGRGHYCYGCETTFHDSNPNITEHKGCKGKKHLGICVDGTEFLKFPYMCSYIKRIPEPGLCTIIEINFEKRELEVSNGAVRLFPSFDEVEIFKVKGHYLSGQPILKKVKWT
jgi:hypothetical protein